MIRARQRRAGVAVELLLRFPQVFPVFLSAAVPTVGSPGNGRDTITEPIPHLPKAEEWRTFTNLQNHLAIASIDTDGADDKISVVRIDDSIKDTIFALQSPLHFVSSLDGGNGLLSTLERFANGMRCWFDPTGLRTLVKNRFLGTVFGKDDDWKNTKVQRSLLLGRLSKCAVVVDEEREFALLSAYAAWKFGRRAWLVATYAEFDGRPTLWSDVADGIVFRDIDLRFPDAPEADNVRAELRDIWSDQWKRRLHPRWTVRAVTGIPCVTANRTTRGWSASEKRLGQRGEREPYEYIGFEKPVSTLYELAAVLGPMAAKCETTTLSRLEPAKSLDPATARFDKGGHGAPYLNLAMAEHLLQQARRSKDEHSAYLIAALLASEAYELLLGMSKTTAMEALLEMHKAEARAEVSFPGVDTALRTQQRRTEIEATVASLHAASGLKCRGNISGVFLSQFWSELRIVYRDGESFSAAEEASRESLIQGAWWSLAPMCLKRGLVAIATSFRAWFLSSLVVMLVATLLYKLDSFISACDFHGPYAQDASKYWTTMAVIISSVALAALAALVTFLANCRSWFLAAMSTALVVLLFANNGNDVAACRFPDLTALSKWETWQRLGDLFLSVVLSSITLQPMTIVQELVGKEGSYHHWVAIIHLGLAYLLFGVLISMLYRKVTRG